MAHCAPGRCAVRTAPPALLLLSLLLPVAMQAGASTSLHTTYLWHMHQPIYWPKSTSGSGNGYEKALDTINNAAGRGNHPTDPLSDTFGWDDREAGYQYRMRDSVASMGGQPDAGAQCTMSGSLLQNVRQLGDNWWGDYHPAGSGWSGWSRNGEARTWKTSDNKPRLDFTCIPAHHPIAPFCDPRTLELEIRVHRVLTRWAYGETEPYTKGFYPPEMCFSERIIPTLVKEGFNWVVVANNHISRACPNFPYINGQNGENCDPPNRADQVNPAGANWFRKKIDRGVSPCNAVPLAMRPHYARHYDPQTGQEYKIIVVPAEMALSWDDGYSPLGFSSIDNNIAPYNDPSHPCLVLFGHDGDNAWGGGYSYYLESIPNFTATAVSKGYQPSTVEQYLYDHPLDAADVVHVEDGGWVNADGDFGSPFMLNWTYFLQNPSTFKIDIEGGWHYKLRDYAIRMAALNWVLEAEVAAGGPGSIDPAKVAEPYSSGASSAEKAWHFYLGSLDSGFQYYGNPGDNEIRVAIACNEALDWAQPAVGGNPDSVPPTVWVPQRYPWNPGSTNFGVQTGYSITNASKDFYVWTFAYDRSGIQSMKVMIRTDQDGINSIANNHNETFGGGADVHAWQYLDMTDRGPFPTNEPSFGGLENISYEWPKLIANHYWVKIISENNALYDYAILATDNAGHSVTSDIQHVYVGSAVPTPAGLTVGNTSTYPGPTHNTCPDGDCNPTWNPGEDLWVDTQTWPAQDGATCTLHYAFNGGSWGATNMAWNENVNDVSYWHVNMGTGAVGVCVQYWVSAANGLTNVADGSQGSPYSICVTESQASSTEFDPPSPTGCAGVKIIYHPNGGPLSGAAQVYAHLGYNNWQTVLPSDAAMTQNGSDWEYTTGSLPYGTYKLDVAFNNGAGVWDNNNSQDWHVNISGCVAPDPLIITNPPSDLSVPYAVSNYTLQGTCATSIVGQLTWTNSLTGQSGQGAANTNWALAALPLGVGTNALTVSGTNRSSGLIVLAEDSASNAVYSSWDDGDNGGSGWGGGWTLVKQGVNAGHYRATTNDANLSIGNYAWGLWANSGDSAEARRPLGSALAAGDVFELKFDNNWISNGYSVGIAFQNAGLSNLFEFMFIGGGTNYLINDSTAGRPTGIPWTGDGLILTFELTGAGAYRFTTPGREFTGSLKPSGDQSVAGFRVWNYSAGPGWERNFYIGDLAVRRASTSGSATSDTVQIVRQASGFVDTDYDGMDDAWEAAHGLVVGINDAAGNPDGDDTVNDEEFIADTDPHASNDLFRTTLATAWEGNSTVATLLAGPPTTNSRVYGAFGATNLVPAAAWFSFGVWMPGRTDGGAVSLTVTNEGELHFFRTGVRLP